MEPPPRSIEIHVAPSLIKGAVGDGSPHDTHSHIQSMWTAYANMADTQRNTLLKGLLQMSSSTQINYICSYLNLVALTDVNHVRSAPVL